MPNPPLSPLVGLGTLAALKGCLLPGVLAATTDYDASLTAIGLGVAAQFDRATGRTLRRSVDAVMEIAAARSFVQVPGYPLEYISGLEVAFFGDAANWQDFSQDSPWNLNKISGIIELGYQYGGRLDVIRVTYTGGYFIPGTLADDGSLAVMPETATILPDDLFSAWTLQCATEFKARNVLQTLSVTTPKEGLDEIAKIGTRVAFQPAVQDVLTSYICRS